MLNGLNVTRVIKPVALFLGGQGSVQLLNAFAGFAILRLIPPPIFAVYSVAFGLQTTLSMLTDLGFGGAILGLVGTRFRDREILGNYIRSASTIRKWLLLIVGTIVLFAAPFGIRHRPGGVSSFELIALLSAVIVSLQFQAWASYYEVPLLLHRRVHDFYRPQIIAALARLAGVGFLSGVGLITAGALIWLNTLSLIFVGLTYRRYSRELAIVPARASRACTLEMIKYLTPLIPGTIYQAFQAQIALFLVATFARLSQVADVAAAGRIGQVFLLLSMSNSVLISPLFARTTGEQLGKRYLVVMSSVCVVALMCVGLSFAFPFLLLWFLGPRYSNLTEEVRLVVIASAISYISGAMWAIAAARKWIFWWGGSLQMATLVTVQAVCVFLLPLSSARGVLTMNIIVGFAQFAVQVLHAFHGFRQQGGRN